MHNNGDERGRGYRGRARQSAPQWGPQYPYDPAMHFAPEARSSRASTLATVAISVLGTLLVAVLVVGLLWWVLRDEEVEAAPGAENFELHDIEVPGRDAALEARGGAVPATAPGDSAPATGTETAGPETGPLPDAITSVPLAGSVQDVSSLPCDGRYVLITASILDNTPDPAEQIASALAMAPGDSMFLMPGACPSLRGFYQGGNVYPVLIDYGFDAAAVCEAAQRGGGNARILSDRFEYLSPC